MRGGSFSSIIPLSALLAPWLAGQSLRHAHPGSIALLSLVLVVLAILRSRPVPVERLILLPLLASSWPAALVGVARDAVGVGRAGLVAGAAALLAIALSARVLAARRALPASQSSLSHLLDTAFPKLMPIARAELALFWFGLFRWRRHASETPADAVSFPGTASGTELAMCLLTATGFLIETPLLHLLLAHVSTETVAWSCTGLHVLLGVYLVGYAKSLLFRPTLLFADRLEIRLGVVARRIVPRTSIEALAAHDEQKEVQAGDQRLFGLDAPNLRLSTAGHGILFRVDEPRRLMEALGT